MKSAAYIEKLRNDLEPDCRDIRERLGAVLGAAHKRLERKCRFPQSMIADLWLCLFGQKDKNKSLYKQERLEGFEAIYARRWIDGWVQQWYFDNSWFSDGVEFVEFNDSSHAAAIPGVRVVPEDPPLDVDVHREQLQRLRELMDVLSDREREILELHFGIGYDYRFRLDEVGRRFNITKERVAQIVREACDKLRRPKYFRYLVGLSMEDYSEDIYLYPELAAKQAIVDAQLKEAEEDAKQRAACATPEVERYRAWWAHEKAQLDASDQRAANEQLVPVPNDWRTLQSLACLNAVVIGKTTPARVRAGYGIIIEGDNNQGYRVVGYEPHPGGKL